MIYSFSQLVDLARQVGFSGGSENTAAAIALAESGGNPLKVNTNYATDPGGSYGLMQINAASHPGYMTPSIYDPVYNMQAAFDISKQGTNFSPWSTFTKGAYKQYLGGVASADAGGVPMYSPNDPTSYADFSGGGDYYTGPSSAQGGVDFGGNFTADPGNATDLPSTSGDGLFGNSTGGSINPYSVGGAVGAIGDIAKGFGGLTNSITGNASPSSWWNTAKQLVFDYLSRGGLILLGIVLIAGAAWALSREAQPT